MGPPTLLAILQHVGPFLDRLTVLPTILQLLARERLPAIASPAANATRSPEKKGTASSSSSSTSPTADRRSSAGSPASTASNVRRAATSTTTPTALSHRSRPSMSALSNTATAGRASAASTARENAISPRPPSAAGRPISAAARGTTGIYHLSRPSTSTLRLRATGPSGTLSASSTTSSKELEALKAKVSDLEEKNKVLSEQLSKAGGHPTTNGDAKTATEELESELAGLKTRITIIQEAVRFYRILDHSRSEANKLYTEREATGPL